jgi:hypothetical protein
VLLSTYSQRSDEDARRAEDHLQSIQNSRKAQLGRLAGLQDPALLAKKQAEEDAFRRAVAGNPRLTRRCGRAWEDIAAALRTWRGMYVEQMLLERGTAFNSRLFGIARTLLRMAEEKGKPNALRLREFRQSNLPSVEQMLFSKAPIFDQLETIELADSLGMLIELKGADNELVRKIMAGKSPSERAAELIAGTRLKDVALRKKLFAGGLPALEAARDPLVELARLVDGPARRVRSAVEQQVEEPMRQAYSKLADARFALQGTNVYPDATSTLRLSFGMVRGYRELGEQIPPWTTLGGAYDRSAAHGGREPFALPRRWLQSKDRLNLGTPLNFVSTADIIGGNSGSPVVNRQGEQVGVIFDGNLPSLVWDFLYDDQQGRAVAVDCRAIKEALRKVYGADALADELGR